MYFWRFSMVRASRLSAARLTPNRFSDMVTLLVYRVLIAEPLANLGRRKTLFLITPPEMLFLYVGVGEWVSSVLLDSISDREVQHYWTRLHCSVQEVQL